MKLIVSASPAGQSLGSGIRAREAGARTPFPISSSEIIQRLEQAGATLLSLPAKGYSTHLRQMRFEIVHTALEAYGWEAPALRAAVPSAAAISAMDECFSWLALIPEQSFLLRRILGARALVHPLTGRYLFPWRRLATTLGADHKSVQRWHATGVRLVHQNLTAT